MQIGPFDFPSFFTPGTADLDNIGHTLALHRAAMIIYMDSRRMPAILSEPSNQAILTTAQLVSEQVHEARNRAQLAKLRQSF